MTVEKPKNMDARFVAGTTVTLGNVEIRYSHLVGTDTKFGEEWNVQCKIDPAKVEELSDLGFNIQEDSGNGTFWLKAKRVVRTRAGKAQTPPVLEMEDGSPVPGEPGNGTVADVHLWCKYTDPVRGKVYMGCYVNGATIKDFKTTASAVTF